MNSIQMENAYKRVVGNGSKEVKELRKQFLL